MHLAQVIREETHLTQKKCLLMSFFLSVWCAERAGKAAPSVFSKARSGAETAFNKPGKK